MEGITIRLDVFEGPLDLLFHLIEKNKIDIDDIPIAELTEQYLDFLHHVTDRKMDDMSEFLVMAATLLEIKSKMLLPKPKQEEENTEQDPRQELVERLLEYQKFKKVTENLKCRAQQSAKQCYKQADVSFQQLGEKEKSRNPADFLQGITMMDLYHAFQEVMQRKQTKTDQVRSSFNSIARDRFTISDKIDYIRDLLIVSPRTTFDAIFRQGSLKIEIVVTFLALLEMMKRKEVILSQKQNFDRIWISKAV